MNTEQIEKRKELITLELKSFELEQRRAKLLAHSIFFPTDLRGNIADAVVIYDTAKRMGVPVMEVAQSVYIINGRPSFSTAYLVARLNQSGLIKGPLRTVISEDKQSCYAVAIDAQTGEELQGMTITMQIAKAEGWLDKRGSKWKTMPELMLRKRAQSSFIKEFFPQVLFGMQPTEELSDVVDVDVTPEVTGPAPQQPADVNALMLQSVPDTPQQPAQEMGEDEKELRARLSYLGVPDDKIDGFITGNRAEISALVSNEQGIEELAEQLKGK